MHSVWTSANINLSLYGGLTLSVSLRQKIRRFALSISRFQLQLNQYIFLLLNIKEADSVDPRSDCTFCAVRS